jgi:hypothetical protein
LGKAAKVKTLEIRWPSGRADTMNEMPVHCVLHGKEGEGGILDSIKRS